MPLRYPLAFTIAACVVCGPVAQSAMEHHLWQDKRKFDPYSRTAESITGAIRLSGNPDFATPGSKMAITFGNGKNVGLTSVGASWRQWEETSDKKATAEVFKLSRDPGALRNGNTLCGDPKSDPAQYVVFFERPSSGAPPLLGMAVFGSKDAPHDINSPNLCSTFNYSSD
ncbi:hypothetical protein [Mesorhizobium sp. M7A.F.Ca.MR.362.00.0.0]|uniref:hypothetical protein n=1 Tax=Mesorhizobium sp. M7A.F.Ca.MR.362.00.0.0 TaxID=2496779 RepID=UPI000FD4B4AB|nr:hypothetical protein [Mesorhizobium sp. M7A.F.Ca.MR.362.00.0.0]RUU82741.1 hypothetical protein EOC06_02820 [Mesorhizobium sp. M7A.F.Ca.MR.362.00.0.0]RWN96568.1 MAG: hypothetical protein EOS05_01085 [Mesorhizobium sp.]